MADWIDRVFAERPLSRATEKQYKSGLRYFQSWFQLRYSGASFPLSDSPARPVDDAVLKDFIEDHMAVSRRGVLGMAMSKDVQDGLRIAGFGCNECVSPRTTEWRLNALGSAHSALHLHLNRQLVNKLKQELHATWAAERVALGAPTSVPMSLGNLLNELLAVCPKNREGYRDIAIIVLSQFLTPKQMSDLRFTDLIPGTIKRAGGDEYVVELHIRSPRSRMQTLVPTIRLIGADAQNVSLWGALRDRDVRDKDLFLIRVDADGSSEKLTATWINRRVRLLAQRAGLADQGGHSQCSSRTIRAGREQEFQNENPVTQVALAARISRHGAARMIQQQERLGES